MLKICHITSAHFPFDNRIFYKECSSLAKKNNFEVYLIQPGHDDFKNNVHILGLGERPENRFKRMTIFSRKAYNIAKKINADIYHIHDPELLRFALKMKKNGKKVIFDSHEFTSMTFLQKDYLPLFLRKIIGRLYSIYEKHVCKKIDGIIGANPEICSYFNSFNSNVCTITNFPLLNNNIEHLGSKDNNTVGCMGHIRPSLNIVNVIKSLNSIPNSRLKLIGCRDEEYLMEIKKTCNRHEELENYGPVKFEHGMRILSSCEAAMILFSYSPNTNFKKGTLGNNKFFEALSIGVPVICTDFEIWKDIINEYNCGVCVNPESVEEITKAISYIFNNKKKAEEMGNNGLRAIKEKYNWNTQERLLYNFYGKFH